MREAIWILRFWHVAWPLFGSLWYWVLIGVAVAEVAKQLLTVERIEGGFLRHPQASVAIATVAGAGLPLCACGVIPFLVAFLRMGLALAPILAFTAASPLMDPADFMITGGVLGWRWAWTIIAAACLLGLTMGEISLFLVRRGTWRNVVKVKAAPANSRSSGVQPGHPEAIFQAVVAFAKDAWFVGKYLLLAIILGAVVHLSLPAVWVAHLLGHAAWYSVPLASCLGLVTYGVSSVPFVKILLSMGMGQGAGMAFLIAGHATSIGLITALATLVRRPVVWTYLAVAMAISLGVGFAFQLV